MTKRERQWAHGWVPLTLRAAILKAHGDHEEAERLIAAGEDEETAYRRAYGVTEDQERRQEAMARLRGDGHRGRTFDQLARSYHREEVRQAYLSAEEATRGHLLSPAGRRAGIDPRSLFDGPAARAHKYASEELRDHWRDHGRLAYEDTKADLLGGRRRTRTAGDAA